MFKLEREGSGPVVVFVHGFCQSSAYWAPTLERVAAQGARGIAVDLPGFGESAAEAGPYTMAGLADALARELDAADAAKVVLVGGSMGGVVAQHFVLRHPARVQRLLLVATGAFTANEAEALVKADALAAQRWEAATVAPIVDGFFHRQPPEPALERYRAIALSASQQAAVEAARSNARNRTLDELEAICVPTLIIQGRHDRARTPEHGAQMRDRIGGAVLVVLEDAGHTPQLEQPERFHETALPFLLASRPDIE